MVLSGQAERITRLVGNSAGRETRALVGFTMAAFFLVRKWFDQCRGVDFNPRKA